MSFPFLFDSSLAFSPGLDFDFDHSSSLIGLARSLARLLLFFSFFVRSLVTCLLYYQKKN